MVLRFDWDEKKNRLNIRIVSARKATKRERSYYTNRGKKS